MSLHVTVHGAGLAGLSAAYHLLRLSPSLTVSLVDPSPVGCGGASAVAAGLVHPFSPKGKMSHRGEECLAALQPLLAASEAARKREGLPECTVTRVVYRLALEEKHVAQVSSMAAAHPAHASPLIERADLPFPTEALCGVQLLTARVIDVPLYLLGLYSHLRFAHPGRVELAEPAGTFPPPPPPEGEVAVYAAGADLFDHERFSDLPASLVRGRSLLVPAAGPDPPPGLICGKYVLPTSSPGTLLVGSTHEYSASPPPPSELADHLHAACSPLSPFPPPASPTITEGTRVNPARTSLGRLPILGPIGAREFVFTGLGGRGVLGHALN
ncbi:hypothetical protein TeGR_g5693 [Tetraparma gracilis]|uniref:FAD dependent oxidoreductase domain-containing protein n=1 Tax=Tetraparma gracilis TaxID=2962635 RepID=A0ABQ6MKE5_9STRA|nr:hypothetical protein TeGR_g5693 [Tetraparma gracilis]